MRIIFMGTPDFAVPALVALHRAGHEIACVYTQPPRRAGRGKQTRPSPVQQKAEQMGIEVRTPKSLRSPEEQARFSALDADVAVVAAYGLILPQEVLDAPEHGCLNIHASILPRWRGAAPIHRAVMAGDQSTGVTIMQMEAGLDTGPMLATLRTPIGEKTTGELTEELAELGAGLLVETLRELDKHVAIAQDDDKASYAEKIDKSEARIDWKRPAQELVHHIHGLSPFPGAWCLIAPGSGSGAGGERVKILRAMVVNPREGGDLSHDGAGSRLRGNAQPGEVLDNRLAIACGSGALRPLELQRAGRPAMALDEFLRGRPVEPGTMIE